MYVAAALSPAFLLEDPVHDQMNDDVAKMIRSLADNLTMTIEKLLGIKSATAEDTVLQQLIRFLTDGWPNTRANIPSALSHYRKLKDEIYEVDGLLFFGQKLILLYEYRNLRVAFG